MADTPKVALTHPDIPGAEFHAHPDAVASWKERGWKTAADKKAAVVKKENPDG